MTKSKEKLNTKKNYEKMLLPFASDPSWSNIQVGFYLNSIPRNVCRARRCKSPDETFYRLWKRCVTYQGRSWVANPCPVNQQLFDGPDNIGVCDCEKNVNGTFIYSNITRQCHALNSQVSVFFFIFLAKFIYFIP